MPHYDRFSWSIQQDPYPVYDWLRNEAPVHHDEAYDSWVLSRHGDVQATLPNAESFVASSATTPDAISNTILLLRLMPDFRVSHVSRGSEHVWIDPNVKTSVAA